MKDWGALIHAGLGLGVGVLTGSAFAFVGLPFWASVPVLLANAAFWVLREAVQRKANGKEPWDFSEKNHREAWPGGILGAVGAAVTYWVMT